MATEVFFSLHQVFICETTVLLQLCQFWDIVQSEQANKGLYTASIRDMKMKFSDLQNDDKKAKKLRSEGLSEGWEDIKQVLHYQGFPYVSKVICSELISKHHNDLFIGYFGIKKTQKLITKKYYWPMLQKDVKAYVKDCNVFLASKAVCYKPYGEFQSLIVLTNWSKNLLMDFVIDLLISANQKGDSYDLILVIVYWLTKMVYYELVKITIDVPSLVKLIINIVVQTTEFLSQLS